MSQAVNVSYETGNPGRLPQLRNEDQRVGLLGRRLGRTDNCQGLVQRILERAMAEIFHSVARE
jgi:hypothetical protein